MQKLSDDLWKQAVDELVESMKDHDLDLKKKDRKEHAREVLAARLEAIHQMHQRFEQMIADASIQTYHEPLRDGNRKQMHPVLTAYPGVKGKTAKAITKELYDS